MKPLKIFSLEFIIWVSVQKVEQVKKKRFNKGLLICKSFETMRNQNKLKNESLFLILVMVCVCCLHFSSKFYSSAQTITQFAKFENKVNHFVLPLEPQQ